MSPVSYSHFFVVPKVTS